MWIFCGQNAQFLMIIFFSWSAFGLTLAKIKPLCLWLVNTRNTMAMFAIFTRTIFPFKFLFKITILHYYENIGPLAALRYFLD